MNLPRIVYLQTLTGCDGHCRYCPHDDVYGSGHFPPARLSERDYLRVLDWLRAQGYRARIGFLLHYEPTLDQRMPKFIELARIVLPRVHIEIATNGLHPGAPELSLADDVCCVPAGSRTWGTSRAGNARACPENSARRTFRQPCRLPERTMSIAANGDVLLCCQDWRHEAVVGTVADLAAARLRQLELVPLVKSLKLEICRDCAAGLTAEEVGERLGHRTAKRIGTGRDGAG